MHCSPASRFCLHCRGLSFPGVWAVQDVVVFLDYQNVYKRARELFHNHYDAHWCGQIDPGRLAQHILDRPSPFERRLKQVRVYRGIPIDARDAKGYAAARRQHAEWQKNPLVKVFARPLRYPYGWPDAHQMGEKPGEKGVDVALAVDFVAMAVRREFDAGILFSVDTDMKPVLEFVASADVPARPEVAAWKNPSSVDYHRRLSIGSNRPFCHWLDDIDYNIVNDPTDYTQQS